MDRRGSERERVQRLLRRRPPYPPAAVRASSHRRACVGPQQRPAIPTAPARAGLRGPARAPACPRHALVRAWVGSVATQARFVTAVALPGPEEPPFAGVRALGCQCQRASPMVCQDRSQPRGQSVQRHGPLIGRRGRASASWGTTRLNANSQRCVGSPGRRLALVNPLLREDELWKQEHG